MQDTTDVAIIGAGPTGLFTVFECGMLKMGTHVIDTLPHIGGQCAALYPHKPIYDIPAYPEISAADLINRLEEQSKPFTPTYHLNQQVVGLEKQEGEYPWQLVTSKGLHLGAKAIVIAAGAGAFGPNRPPLADLETYEGTGTVQYSVYDPEALRGKRLVIAGGGDSAVDWALMLADIADHITVVHRRDKFRAAPENVEKMRQLAETNKLTLQVPYQLHGLKGENGHLTHVVVQDMEKNDVALEADVLLPFYGLSMNLGPIAEWGLGLDKKHIKTNPATAETSIPGIFAVGDVATYPGKLKLILTGFAEAALAAHSAYGYVYPDQALHFEYSTSKGVAA